MNVVALKMLVGDKLKYYALVAGVAFAALLITQQASIFTGYALQTGAWVRDSSFADLWVMDDQTEFSDDFKPMLDTALARVRGVEGVQWAVPMFKSYIDGVLPDGTRKIFRVVGLDDASLAGGPPEMVQGTMDDLRKDRAVIINARGGEDLLLRRLPQPRMLSVGDRLSLNDNELRVVGTYNATPEFFWEPVLYTTYSRARGLNTDMRRTLQFVHVKVRDSHTIAAVQDRILRRTGLTALTAKQFEERTMMWILTRTGILINFGITIALGLVIGLLVAGQTFYTFILDNLRNFGALKAMGLSNWRVIGMMSVQVLVVAAVGFGLGVGGASITGAMFSQIGMAFQMPWQIPVGGFVAVLVCCLAAGAMSIASVLKLEPAVVFR